MTSSARSVPQLSAAVRAGGFDLVVTEPVDFGSLQRSIATADDDRDHEKATTKIPVLKPRDR